MANQGQPQTQLRSSRTSKPSRTPRDAAPGAPTKGASAGPQSSPPLPRQKPSRGQTGKSSAPQGDSNNGNRNTPTAAARGGGRGESSTTSSVNSGVASYLRILFPDRLQNRKSIPRLLTSRPFPALDAEAYQFLALLVRDFIQVWYSSFSTDSEFVTSIVNVVMHVVRELERRSQEVDWVALLLQDTPEVLRQHYVDYRQAIQKHDTLYAPNQTVETIFHGLQPHFALTGGVDSEESEMEYLRQMADELLKHLLPKREYESDCVRWLVREVLACLVLKSLVEILTEPDMVNFIINTLLSSFEAVDEEYEKALTNALKDILLENSTRPPTPPRPKARSIRQKLTHRSSTPNIKTTDAMIDLLQEAQSTGLDDSPPLASSSRFGTMNSLGGVNTVGPVRNDNHLTTLNTPATSRSAKAMSNIYQDDATEMTDYRHSQEQSGSHITDRHHIRSSSSDSKSSHSGPQGSQSAAVQAQITLHWLVLEAPFEFSTYFVQSIFIPLVAFFTFTIQFLLGLPKQLRAASQSSVWLYTALETVEHEELDAGILSLMQEVFFLEDRNKVVWRQWEIMGWPLVRTLCGGMIDRVLTLGVYWIFDEPQLVEYLKSGRRALWPDPNSAPPRPRGVSEMQQAKLEAERRILRAVPKLVRDLFFGTDIKDHWWAARDALEPLQNKRCNKHLMYVILDLAVARTIPEMYSGPPEK